MESRESGYIFWLTWFLKCICMFSHTCTHTQIYKGKLLNFSKVPYISNKEKIAFVNDVERIKCVIMKRA